MFQKTTILNGKLLMNSDFDYAADNSILYFRKKITSGCCVS